MPGASSRPSDSNEAAAPILRYVGSQENRLVDAGHAESTTRASSPHDHLDVCQESAMKKANVAPDPEAARIAAAYATKPKAIDYVAGKLAAVTGGKSADLDFIAGPEVTAFCAALGFEKTWSGRTIEEIARRRSSKVDADDFGPAVIVASEATAILEALERMITKDHFVGTKESRFDKTILNDFIPRSRATFEGAPTLGHLWELQFALQVELEHGRTRGTNVTNNHPILTGLVVMAHLSEDTLYYARLWVMESEGELTALIARGKKADELAKIAKELNVARLYLAKRLLEKAEHEGTKLPR